MTALTSIPFRVEQSEAPTFSLPSLAQTQEVQEVQTNSNLQGNVNNPGLIAGLTISAFVVGMLFAFLVCYIHHSRRSMNADRAGSKSRSTNTTTILPFVTPTRVTSTRNIPRNPSPQAAIPWEADYYTEMRDRLGDLGDASLARSQGRQSISSGTVMTDSNFSTSRSGSPTTALSPSSVALSSYFYAPSTVPSIGPIRTGDRKSLLTS